MSVMANVEDFGKAVQTSLAKIDTDPVHEAKRQRLEVRERERQLLIPDVFELWLVYRERNIGRKVSSKAEIQNHQLAELPGISVIEYQPRIQFSELVRLEDLVYDRRISHAGLIGVNDPNIQISLVGKDRFFNPFLNDNYDKARLRIEEETGVLPENLLFQFWAGTSNHHARRIRVEEQKEVAFFTDPSQRRHALSLRRLQALGVNKGSLIEIAPGITTLNPIVFIYKSSPRELRVLKNTLEKGLDPSLQIGDDGIDQL